MEAAGTRRILECVYECMTLSAECKIHDDLSRKNMQETLFVVLYYPKVDTVLPKS